MLLYLFFLLETAEIAAEPHCFEVLDIVKSTAVEQVVACALVTQRARVRSPVGTGFLGEVFFGVFPHR